MKLFERTIEIARTYLGKTESAPNNAAWLQQLMKSSGNPCHWATPEPYCISAATACFALAYKEAGLEWPKTLNVPSTQTFYDRAAALEITDRTPKVGSIVIFRLGKEWHGHAEIVIGVGPEGLDTIGFNTGSTNAGNQRNGEGVFLKRRNFAQFQKSDTHLWIRGYVNMPHADEEMPGAIAEQAMDTTTIITPENLV